MTAEDILSGGSPPVPPALRGLWTREVIFTPSGYRDETTKVVWLQTHRAYADLRVPADRPNRPGATGFADYPDEDLIALAAVQGFAGVLTATADTCLWRRDLDFQPPGETPDEARFEIDGDRMAEIGIHADYTEIWRRAPLEGGFVASLVRTDGPGGLLVIAGDHFLEIQDRAAPGALPPPPVGATLGELVRADLDEGRRDRAEARLSMPIRHGRIAGAGAPWRVTLSTLPWLEGASLFAGEVITFDAAGELRRGDGSLWRVAGPDAPLGALAAVFALAGAAP